MSLKDKVIFYINDWERKCYVDGLPDEAPQPIAHLVPDYRKICLAIMKNDRHLQTLGFCRPKCRAYDELKKIELRQRGTLKFEQTKLF